MLVVFNIIFFTRFVTLTYCTYVDIQKFNIKYLITYKVQIHTGAISYLEYGSCVCTGDNPLAEARGLSSHTDAQTILLLSLNFIWIAGKGRQHKLMLKNKLDNILPFRWADGWSISARSVKEGVYMNHFKFSATLGGYLLRYQEPTPQGERKGNWYKLEETRLVYFNIKWIMSYILPGISRKINRHIS